MTRGFETTPPRSTELLPEYSQLFRQIGSRFIYGDYEEDINPSFVYVEIEETPIRFEDGHTEVVKLGSVLLAESFNHHAKHVGELLRLGIPVGDDDDIWLAVNNLENDDRYDPTNATRLRVITTHTSQDREVAFKITGSDITPARKPRFGSHSRFTKRGNVEAYLEDTSRKLMDWPMIPLKSRGGSND